MPGHEPAYPGLHQKKCGQLGEGSAPALLLGRPDLAYCIQVWSSQYRRDVDLLDRVQRRAANMIQGMEHLSFEDTLRELGPFILEKRRLRRDLITACQYLNGGYQKEGGRLGFVVMVSWTWFHTERGEIYIGYKEAVFLP